VFRVPEAPSGTGNALRSQASGALVEAGECSTDETALGRDARDLIHGGLLGSDEDPR
jgi:hypothetical protein